MRHLVTECRDIFLRYSPGLKFTSFSIIARKHISTFPSYKCTGQFSHEPSLKALACTSLLSLSGRASGLVNQKVIVSTPFGSTWVFFFRAVFVTD